jgi:hypothetical protein
VPGAVECRMIELMQLSAEPQEPVSVDIPVSIQHILDQFEVVFATPTTLPPRRACDHKISLVPGVAPVATNPQRRNRKASE